ncbi:MAG: DUF2505 domain-containing protein [Gammaproteobacteria bacterium]|nr:DUF2505 domain-containing protein [Gammaproteobacteria bacterium]
MKHEMKARYPASSEVVLKMFSDPAFHTRKLEAMGLSKFTVLSQGLDGDEFHIRIERRVPLDAPGVVKKVVPAESSVVNEERWNLKKKTGRVIAEPKGIPIDMSCTASFKDDGKDCVITYVWDVRAKVPLIGGALEKFVCSDMERRFADETRAAIPLLAGYR